CDGRSTRERERSRPYLLNTVSWLLTNCRPTAPYWPALGNTCAPEDPGILRKSGLRNTQPHALYWRRQIPPFRTRSKRGPRNRASSVHDRPVRSRLDPASIIYPRPSYGESESLPASSRSSETP